MKLAVSNYPFAVYAETKVSPRTEKEYTSVSVKFTTKDKNGEKIATYFNLFDERDLLVLANLCNRAYQQITDEKTLERFSSTKEEKEEPKKESEPIDDDIPFDSAWN